MGVVLVTALLAAFTLGSPAQASVVEAMNLEELVADSDRVVIGRVVFAESFLRRNGTIVTVYRFQVERELLDGVPTAVEEPEIQVGVLGGRVGDVGMRVEGEPRFSEGERALLFIRDGGNLMFRPVGMAQGVMRIRFRQGREMVSQAHEHMMLVRRGASGQLEKARGALVGQERLDTMVERVRRIVRARARVTP